MRKKIWTRSTFVVLLMIVLCLALFLPAHRRHIETELSIRLPWGARITEYTDTHGGFHGDGETVAVVKLSEKQGRTFAQRIAVTAQWRPLPMTETIALLIQGGEKDGVTYPPCPHFILEGEGVWYFRDRSGRAHEPGWEDDILDFNAYNFTFAFYDTEENILYYYELDT